MIENDVDIEITVERLYSNPEIQEALRTAGRKEIKKLVKVEVSLEQADNVTDGLRRKALDDGIRSTWIDTKVSIESFLIAMAIILIVAELLYLSGYH